MPTMAPHTTALRQDKEFSVSQAAIFLGRNPATVREYIHSGILPAHRIGTSPKSGFRIYESDLVRLVQPVEPARANPVEAPVEDDLAALAARMVATWPLLSAERKRELGRLLGAA